MSQKVIWPPSSSSNDVGCDHLEDGQRPREGGRCRAVRRPAGHRTGRQNHTHSHQPNAEARSKHVVGSFNGVRREDKKVDQSLRDWNLRVTE